MEQYLIKIQQIAQDKMFAYARNDFKKSIT